jgi:hypothetical protein
LGWLAKGVDSHCGEARNVGLRFWRAVIICCYGQYVASVTATGRKGGHTAFGR